MTACHGRSDWLAMLEPIRLSGSLSPSSGFQSAWRPFSVWPPPHTSFSSREPFLSSEKQVLRYVVPPSRLESLTKSYRLGHTETQSNVGRAGNFERKLLWRTKTLVGGEKNVPEPSSSLSLIACEAVWEAVGTFSRPKHLPMAEDGQVGVAFATLVPVRPPL